MPAPKKSLGQNFLMHPQIAERIVFEARLEPGIPVLEIGPGTGMLTRALLAAGHPVVGVEADGELIEVLNEKFADEIGEGRLVLVHEDIRNFQIQPYLGGLQQGDEARFGDSYSLVANIPYYLTGEIIRTFLTATHKPRSMTLLVQKEVAERIARLDPKRPKESLLSLSVKAYGTPRYCFTVPRGAFNPAPNVDSAVISISDIRPDSFENPESEGFFFDLLHAGFAHKRKVLMGNLAEIAPADRIREAFEAASIPEKTRSEDLSLEKWKRLAAELATG